MNGGSIFFETGCFVLPLSQFNNYFGLYRYISFVMYLYISVYLGTYITKGMYLEKPKRLEVSDQGSSVKTSNQLMYKSIFLKEKKKARITLFKYSEIKITS
jgi:hypothetical protein